ncbi:MAG TPA: YWFCY domain-containing protein, partial [Daejeonella sp.]
MATGENEQGLRKIMDFTRLLSIAILVIHFYLLCYAAFREWELTTSIVDRILSTFSNMKIFKTILASKVASLLLLAVSLLGVKGKKDEKIEKRTAIVYILTGLILFFISQSMLLMQFSVSIKSGAYIGITSIGYFLILTGGT